MSPPQSNIFGPAQQNTSSGFFSSEPIWKQCPSQHPPPQLQNPPLQQNSAFSPDGTGISSHAREAHSLSDTWPLPLPLAWPFPRPLLWPFPLALPGLAETN